MPFKSDSQRRWMYANEPAMAKRWSAKTPKGKKLPEKVGDEDEKKSREKKAALLAMLGEVVPRAGGPALGVLDVVSRETEKRAVLGAIDSRMVRWGVEPSGFPDVGQIEDVETLTLPSLMSSAQIISPSYHGLRKVALAHARRLPPGLGLTTKSGAMAGIQPQLRAPQGSTSMPAQQGRDFMMGMMRGGPPVGAAGTNVHTEEPGGQFLGNTPNTNPIGLLGALSSNPANMIGNSGFGVTNKVAAVGPVLRRALREKAATSGILGIDPDKTINTPGTHTPELPGSKGLNPTGAGGVPAVPEPPDPRGANRPKKESTGWTADMNAGVYNDTKRAHDASVGKVAVATMLRKLAHGDGGVAGASQGSGNSGGSGGVGFGSARSAKPPTTPLSGPNAGLPVGGTLNAPEQALRDSNRRVASPQASNPWAFATAGDPSGSGVSPEVQAQTEATMRRLRAKYKPQTQAPGLYGPQGQPVDTSAPAVPAPAGGRPAFSDRAPPTPISDIPKHLQAQYAEALAEFNRGQQPSAAPPPSPAESNPALAAARQRMTERLDAMEVEQDKGFAADRAAVQPQAPAQQEATSPQAAGVAKREARRQRLQSGSNDRGRVLRQQVASGRVPTMDDSRLDDEVQFPSRPGRQGEGALPGDLQSLLTAMPQKQDEFSLANPERQKEIVDEWMSMDPERKAAVMSRAGINKTATDFGRMLAQR